MRIVKIALTILGSAVFAALLSVTVYIMVCGCIGKTASIFGYSVHTAHPVEALDVTLTIINPLFI